MEQLRASLAPQAKPLNSLLLPSLQIDPRSHLGLPTVTSITMDNIIVFLTSIKLDILRSIYKSYIQNDVAYLYKYSMLFACFCQVTSLYLYWPTSIYIFHVILSCWLKSSSKFRLIILKAQPDLKLINCKLNTTNFCFGKLLLLKPQSITLFSWLCST